MTTRRGFFLLFVFLLASCSQPRIDTSTDETSQASIARVRESLPEIQRARFDTALQVLAFSELNLGSLVSEAAVPGFSGTVSRIKELLDGKTGAEVIAAADSIVRARVEKEIRELDDRRMAAERAKRELAKFAVLQARLRTQGEYVPMRVVELTVRNGTNQPISHARFVGTLVSPGRSVPWAKDDFGYPIPGGLEPGEQATWRVYLGSYNDLAIVKAPSEAVLSVEVVRLDGPKGQTLYSTTDFTEEDAARLATLRAKLPKP